MSEQNPFVDADAEVDDEGTTTPPSGNQSKAWERLSAKLAKLEAENTELRTVQTEAEKGKAFTDLGIDPKYTELYSGAVDTEAIKEWATKFGFVSGSPSAPTTEGAGAPEAPKTEESKPIPGEGMAPVIGGGTPFAGKMTAGDYAKLSISPDLADRAKAQKAWDEGRVELMAGGRFTGPGTVTTTPHDQGQKQG